MRVTNCVVECMLCVSLPCEDLYIFVTFYEFKKMQISVVCCINEQNVCMCCVDIFLTA